MSVNFNAPNPLQGSPQAQTDAVFRATEEREAQPVGNEDTHQPIPVPVKLADGYQPSSLTSILKHDPAESPVAHDVGFGPRVVILHNYVTGPRVVTEGEDRPAYQRGQVVWLSALFGPELTQKALDGDAQALAQVRRYTMGKNPAIRQATKDEENVQMVTFLEGEKALGDAFQAEQAARTQAQDENVRFRSILEKLNIDPNASPEQIEAQLNALNTQRSQPNAPPVPPQPPQQPQGHSQTTQAPTPPQQTQQPVQRPTTTIPPTPPPTPPPTGTTGTGGTGGTGGGSGNPPTSF